MKKTNIAWQYQKNPVYSTRQGLIRYCGHRHSKTFSIPWATVVAMLYRLSSVIA